MTAPEHLPYDRTVQLGTDNIGLDAHPRNLPGRSATGPGAYHVDMIGMHHVRALDQTHPHLSRSGGRGNAVAVLLMLVWLGAAVMSAPPASAQFQTGSSTTSTTVRPTTTAQPTSTTSSTAGTSTTTTSRTTSTTAPSEQSDLARTGLSPGWVVALGAGMVLSVGGEVGRRKARRPREPRAGG